QLMSLHPSFSLSSSRRHPHTHSFPTRRSSDLCRATRFRAGGCQLYLWHRVLYRDSSRKPVRDPVPSGKEPYRRFAITEKLCGLENLIFLSLKKLADCGLFYSFSLIYRQNHDYFLVTRIIILLSQALIFKQ